MPYADKQQRTGSQSTATLNLQKQGLSGLALSIDNSPKMEAQKKWQEMADRRNRVVLPGRSQSEGPHPLELIEAFGPKALDQLVGYKQSLLQFLKDAPMVDKLDEKGKKIYNMDGTTVKVKAFQIENSILPLYIKAWDVYYSEFKPEVQRIGRIVNGEAKIAPFKGEDRAKEKIVKEYHNDVNNLVDVVRGSIVCKTAAQAIQAYEEIRKSFNVVRVKNRFKNPVGGYRDMLINVRLKNGHIAEIQVHLADIINYKEGDGHALYEKVRALADKVEAGTITPDEQAMINEVNAETKKMYDKAWEKAKAIPDK